MALDEALLADDSEKAAAILVEAVSGTIARFDEALPTALRGGFTAVAVVVSTWDALIEQSLRSAALVAPGSLEMTEPGVLKVGGQPVAWLSSHLRTAVTEAPFSRFVGAYGSGPGMAVACVAKVREAVAELTVLLPPRGGLPQLPETVDVLRFRRLAELAIRGMAPPLERLQDALGLTKAELGGIFGVSRQAIDQWRTRGIPPERRGKVADLLAVVDVLERKLKPGRLPLVARRPASAFGGRSLLELAAGDEQAQLRDAVERAFDWSTAA
jgi:transcriptional regulator with XRE-family HTH domain